MPQAKRLTEAEIEELKREPPTDVPAFVRLVLDYIGPTPDPTLDALLDTDAELRRRAVAILAVWEKRRPNKGWSAGSA